MNSLLMFFSRGSSLAFGSPPWSLGMFGQPCHKFTRPNHAHSNTVESTIMPEMVRVGFTLDSQPPMLRVMTYLIERLQRTAFSPSASIVVCGLTIWLNAFA